MTDDSIKMVSRCTCGAPLPLDAMFCYRCGRPQQPEVRGNDEPIALPGPEERELPRLSARQYLRAAGPPALVAIALRFLIGSLAWLLGIAELTTILGFGIVWLAGHYAVRLFQDRIASITGLWHGFGVGALTGLLCFLPSLVTHLAVFGWQGREAFLEALRVQSEDSALIAGAIAALEDSTVFWSALIMAALVEAMVLAAGAGAFGALAARGILNERLRQMQDPRQRQQEP